MDGRGGSMTDDQIVRIIEAISQLRQDFMTALNQGLANVNITIQQLTERHARDLLEQEKRNATFAEKSRLDSLAERLHDTRNEVAEHTSQIHRLEAAADQVLALVTQIRDLGAHELPPDVRAWALRAHKQHVDHEETRQHITRQVLGYLTLAVTGATLAALGLGQIAHQLAHVLGGH